ncbi:MAG: hypothetical protein IT169_17145 [Bryobacterales bacterium]|nr:hypothetical protein [Bryobacterales bacterium]
MTVNGRLSGASTGYAGHEVEIFLPILSGGGAGAATIRPVLMRAAASADGRFSFEVEPGTKLSAPMEITVRAPSGERLAFATQASLGNIAIKVSPRAALPVSPRTAPTDPALGPVKLRIALQDLAEQSRAANQLVSVWGERAGSAEPAEIRVVLGAAYADARGVATIEIPRAAYRSLEAEVPGHRGPVKRFALALTDEGLPRESAEIAVDLETGSGAADDEDECDCKAPALPRTPGHEDLAGTGVFAADAVAGGCVSLAVPNRTIEEYAFQSLVRTTDPYLFGIKPQRPRPLPLPPTALTLAAELAYGFSSLDAQLAQGATGSTGLQPGARASAVLRTGEAALDTLRLESHAYRSTGLAGARAWRETGARDKVLSAIMERASSLSEETLRNALADPDGFTPVALMTAERQRAFERLEEKVTEVLPGKGRVPVAAGSMPLWDAQPKTYQAATIAHGHLLEWRQVWRADGYSLGDLLYSLPLAPGQKRQIVVVDWDRQETGIRTESRTVAESFSADLSRDRDVAEIVNSTVSESIRAGSKTRTWGAGGGLGLAVPFKAGFFGMGVAGGGGGSDSKAWQDSARALSASAGQNISDRTQQAATAVRSQRATVVTGRRQTESVSVTAEVVANYNHCHSMTVEYFEVLKHYRVDLELASVRECLFIPLQMTRFDEMKALRWRDPVTQHLRDGSLAGGFDAIERILTSYADSDLPLARYADEAVTELWGELRVELDIRRPREPREGEDINDYLNRNWQTWNVLFGPGSAARAYDESVRERALAEKIFASELAPRIARAFGDTLRFELFVDTNGTPAFVPAAADFTMVSDYRPGREHLIAFRCILPAGQQFTRAQIKGVRVSTTLGDITPGSRSILRYIHVSYRNRFRSATLLSPRRLRDEIKAGDAVFVAAYALSKAEELNPRQEDLRLRDRLLKHLNEHVEHYHQVIWWLMDSGRRFMLLDGFIAPDSGDRSVASVTENRLIGIVGNSLVMPVAPGYVLDPIARNAEDPERPIDLMEAYRPKIPFAPKRISVPTRGVHAEAILGECDSCEILDNRRFWDWASEPVEDEPTAIAESSTASRRETPPDTGLTPFQAPIVAIQNTPDAPLPTTLGELTKVLAQKDLFKDVTGLEGNQANALQAFQRAMQTANFFGKMAAAGAKASFTNRRSEDVMKKVNAAVKSGDMSKEDGKAVIDKMLSQMKGDTGESDKALTGKPAVKDAMKKVAQGAGELSVSKETGDGSESVSAKFGGKEAGSKSTDIQIEGVEAINQVKSEGCWAAAATMLIAFQRKQSIAIETLLAEVGAPYPEKYANNTGLKPSEIAAFKDAFHLRDAGAGALTLASLSKRLSERGPLWIVVDDDPSRKFSAHARVITGIKGTRVRFIDPNGGVEGDEEFSALVKKLDELSKGIRSAFGGYAPQILSL